MKRTLNTSKNIIDLTKCEGCENPVNITCFESNETGCVRCRYVCNLCGHITTKTC